LEKRKILRLSVGSSVPSTKLKEETKLKTCKFEEREN